MRRITKKMWLLLGIGAVAAMAVVGAYAYWTTNGSGTGSATSAADLAQQLVVAGNLTGTIAPGQSLTVPVTVTNPAANSGHAYLKKVDVVVDATSTGCDDTWFSFASVTFNESIAPGASSTKNGTLVFANEPSINQDDCKNSAIALTYTVNNS